MNMSLNQKSFLANLAALTIVPISLAIIMNQFHDDIDFFCEEIGYVSNEVMIKKFLKSFGERKKHMTRSLNEIECTKTFYEFIKEDQYDIFNVWDNVLKSNMEVEKLSMKLLIEMKTKLKPYLKARAKLAFREKSLCENSFMKITFSTKTHPGILAFLSSRKIGQIMDDWVINNSLKLLKLELRLTLNKNWQNIKYAIVFSPYSMPHKDSQKHKIDVEIRFSLRKTIEDKTENNLLITTGQQDWKLTGQHFLNTLYVLIIIFMFKFRFNVIIDFRSYRNCCWRTLVRFRFQIILKR